MAERDSSYLDNPLCMASVESMEETSAIETSMGSVEDPSVIPKGYSGLEMQYVHSGVDAHEVPSVVVEGNATDERHEVEKSNGSHLDAKNLVSKSGACLLPTEDDKCSEDKVDESSSYGAINSSLPEVCSSAEFVSNTHVEGHVLPSAIVESIQMDEENKVPRQCDVDKCDKDVPVIEQKGIVELPSDDSNRDIIIDKGVGTSSFGEGSIEIELIVSKPQSDTTAVSESASDFTFKDANLSCNTVGDAPVSSENCITTDVVVDHKDFEVSGLPAVFTYSDKEEDTVAKISTEASLSDHKASSQATTGVDPVSESEKESSAAAEEVLCEPVDHSLSVVDARNTESRIDCQTVVIEKDGHDTKDEEVCPIHCGSITNQEYSIEALVNDDKKLKMFQVSFYNEILGSVPLAIKESCHDTSLKVQEENTVMGSGDMSFEQTAVPSTNVVHERSDDLDKPAGGSPAVIRTTELSCDQSNKEELKILSNQGVSVSEVTDGNAIKMQSASKDPNQNDASKDDSSFTFEVTPLADPPQKDAKKWQPFSNIEASKVPLIYFKFWLRPLDPKTAQDISRGSPKFSDVAIAHDASKRGQTTSVSLSPSGVSQLVQSNEMQRYGHVDTSNLKPFVLATSTSGLPDLNSSVSPAAMFQQPFTDLQQVQLRAQIFVYGALIQGTAPDEAYMISAFGGPDGGRSIWESAWRSCLERLHGQKSHLITPETPRNLVQVLELPSNQLNKVHIKVK
ncbi:hypothetical protein GH714_009248 [Hevea brasiliensis]|uniref:Uncharacterized protein n=1 Tax=Hevea brasiliensis TaxID=3981 RepID=A0A6A6ML58_HEVBR|nr:hypothetical protein GH714_009248 [Hevea brasiliensis]